MKKANEKYRDGELLSVWSLDRTIFVKTSPAGKPIKVSELEDLDHLQISHQQNLSNKICISY